MQKYNPISDIIELNVGGATDGLRISKDVMCKVPDSILGEMFSGRHEIKKLNDGRVFIDRNPKVFSYVLDYLRNDLTPLYFEDKTVKHLFDLELKHWKLSPEEGSANLKKKIQDIFNSEPQRRLDKTSDKWKELEPLNLDKIIEEQSIEFDASLEVKHLIKYNGFNTDYSGQVDPSNQACGFGRFTFYDGTIQEGSFVSGKLNTFGRVLFTSGDYYQG